MKKTLNINLAGFPFIIDDDAYQILKDYLDTIRYAFETQDDTNELATDIESRIAEILIEKEGGGVRIVTAEEITNVIERIGKPSEFIEMEDTVISSEDKFEGKTDEKEEIRREEEILTPPPYDSSKYSRNPFVRKRIFRDPQNAMLGGVCAGIAAYLHIDVTVVRLLTVLLFFLSASTVAIVYIVLWIVVPEARTSFQRMQMLGEDATVENIGKKVTENYQRGENPNNLTTSKGGFAGFVSSALSIFVKILIALGLIIAAPLLLALGVAFLGCAIAIFVIGLGLAGGGMFDNIGEGIFVLYILLAVLGGAITIGIPLWLFIRKFWKKRDTIQSNPNNQRTLLIIWLCGIALLSVFTVKAVKQGHRMDMTEWAFNVEQFKELDNMDENDIEDVIINNKGISFKTKSGDKVIISKNKKRKGISTEIIRETETIEDTINATASNDSIRSEEIISDTLRNITIEPDTLRR